MDDLLGSGITITTWNILAPSCADKSPQGFPYARSEDLETEIRLQRILTHLRKLNSDVFCLQEVEQPIYDKLVSTLKDEGYSWSHLFLGSRKHGVAVISRIEGTISAFNFTDSSQAYMILDVKVNDKVVHIVNCHLKAKPQFENERGLQITHLLSLELRGKTVICGDFNATPEEAAIQLLRDHGYRWIHDPYSPLYTTMKRRNIDNIIVRVSDYIFTSASLQACTQGPQLSYMLPIDGWPNEDMPSDHAPISAMIYI